MTRMTAATRDLYVEQGATFSLAFTWTDGDIENPGAPIDLTGAEARMQFRQRQQSPSLLDAESSGQDPMITLGGAAGTVTIVIPDTATDLLDSTAFKYDLEIEMADGTVYRMLEGKVTVSPNITQLPGDPVVN